MRQVAPAILLSIFFSWNSSAAEITDVERSADKFSYHELGHHLPTSSGYPGYEDPRQLVSEDMVLPIKFDEKAGQRIYCNSQVFGFNQQGKSGGKGNHASNFTFPMSPTMCEIRWVKGKQLTELCGRDPGTNKLRTTHQGTDCRPPTPEGGVHDVVAVEDGVVFRIKEKADGSVYLEADSGVVYKYRHVSKIGVKANTRVKKGDVLAKVSDLKIGANGTDGTPVHAHLECLIAQKYKDCFPSITLAYLKRLNLPYKVSERKLEFNDCFEIKKGASKPARSGAECGQSSDGASSSAAAETACVVPDVLPMDKRQKKSETSRNFLALTVYRPEKGKPYSRIAELENFPGWTDNQSTIDTQDGWIYAFDSDESGVGVSYYWLMKRARYLQNRLRPVVSDAAFSMAGVDPSFCSVDFAPTAEGINAADSPKEAKANCGKVMEYKTGYLAHSKRYFSRNIDWNTQIDLTNPDELWNWMRTMYRHESGREIVVGRETFDRGIKLAKEYLNNGNTLPRPYADYLYSCVSSHNGDSGTPSDQPARSAVLGGAVDRGSQTTQEAQTILTGLELTVMIEALSLYRKQQAEKVSVAEKLEKRLSGTR